jgi:hypothetical protein
MSRTVGQALACVRAGAEGRALPPHHDLHTIQVPEFAAHGS